MADTDGGWGAVNYEELSLPLDSSSRASSMSSATSCREFYSRPRDVRMFDDSLCVDVCELVTTERRRHSH